VLTAKGPLEYVGEPVNPQNRGGRIELGTRQGGDWKFTPLPAAPLVEPSRMALRQDRVATTAWQARPDLSAIDVVLLDAGKPPRPMLSACPPFPDEAVVIDPHGPVVVGACGKRVAVMELIDDAAHERLAWPAEDVRLAGAAVDRNDRLHVLLTMHGTKAQHVILEGDAKSDVPLPAGARPVTVAVCKGDVEALFDVGDGAGRLAFGMFRENAWKLEDVDREGRDEAFLGFDESCRPFAASGGDVWSRATGGWKKSSIGPDSRIKGLVGYRGTLYALYEDKRDGGRVGVATAPTAPEARAASSAAPN
jgi:hypothetical protein